MSPTSELDVIEIDLAEDTWYDGVVTFEADTEDTDTVTVTRTSPTPGDPVAILSAQSDVLESLGG